MNETSLLYLLIFILFAPLIGFTFTVLLGKRIQKMYLFETGVITLTFLAGVIAAYTKLFVYADKAKLVWDFNWIATPAFNIHLGIMMDNITAMMIFVVCLISMLVHYYSIEYMHGDKRFNRYFAYLGIFTFSMMGIVLTHNILMMYIFWELVGLSSYLLIGFWFEKKSASDASKKAFLVNRVGDLGMFAGIMIVFITYHTFTFEDIFAQISAGTLPFNSEFWLTMMGILLFCGAIGKSAQFPLHVWLPDAMEGPTPVSALIHAATMVAAGVYLVVRIFPMLTGDAMLFIASIGALSAFIPATIALTQNDIKKVLAYSTISQLGYMIMALGVGAYAYGFFHLVTHAFFKAGLFLGSGSVIHAMHHEQDIRQMGGLKKKMPITYATFLFYSLAICGIPLTSGFLSKDGILQSAFAFGSLTGKSIFAITGFLVALMTAFYMFRLVILTFHGTPRNEEKYHHAHESPTLMTAPLVLLAVLSISFFYTLNPISADSGWVLSKWIKTPVSVVPESARYSFMVDKKEVAKHEAGVTEEKTAEHTAQAPAAAPEHSAPVIHSEEYTEAMHHAHYPAMGLSLLVAGLGIGFAFIMYGFKKINPDTIANAVKPLYNFSLNKWYFDEFYNAVFVGFVMFLSRFLAWFDATIIDGIVNGVASLTRGVSWISGKFDTYVVDGLVNFVAIITGFFGILFRKTQTGRVQTYIVLAVFSIVVIILFFTKI